MPAKPELVKFGKYASAVLATLAVLVLALPTRVRNTIPQIHNKKKIIERGGK
jgi:hypothetical protein